MEPMSLGSPSSSPASTSQYLPSFLMGEQQMPSNSRSNTLSPNKAGTRNISFAATSPQDVNRSVLGQKTLFGCQQTPPSVQTHNGSLSGPPTQGLFDSLRSERNQIQTPNRQQATLYKTSGNQTPFSTPIPNNQINQTQMTDMYLSSNSYDSSRITSPIQTSNQFEYRNNTSMNSPNLLHYPLTPRFSDFWVTVFGFPQSATTMILSHFSQCGTIIDKKFPSQSGNWVHLKFSCRLECDKALNFNEKILGNNIMIGVTQCKDKSIVDKENVSDNLPVSKLRPLSQIAYKSAQNETAVMSPNAPPQRSSGIMNKAMDLFFGW